MWAACATSAAPGAAPPERAVVRVLLWASAKTARDQEARVVARRPDALKKACSGSLLGMATPQARSAILSKGVLPPSWTPEVAKALRRAPVSAAVGHPTEASLKL